MFRDITNNLSSQLFCDEVLLFFDPVAKSSAQKKRKEYEQKTDDIAQAVFSSPFKRREISKRQRITDGEQRVDLPSGVTISPLILHTTPKIRVQLDLIENYWKEHALTVFELQHLRNKINLICTDLTTSEDQKLAELGMLYYYLTRGEKNDFVRWRDAESLVKKRRDELLGYLNDLALNHLTLGLKEEHETLPSGCLAYLQRAFATMIFSEEGATFNLGGCYAIRELLQSALNLYLIDEWRKQVLIIVDRFIQDPDFREQFMRPIKVHSSLEELIRIDLKLPQHSRVNSSLVRLDLLISFFTLMGQLPKENNCFAIGTTVFFFSQNPHVVLSLYLEILEKGSFTLGEYEIPVCFLLETKVVSESDFNFSLHPQVSQHLIGVRQAQEILKQGMTHPVGSTLHDFLINNFPTDVEQAKRIFSSFKINSLQRMIFSVFVFLANNNTEASLRTPKARCVKEWAELLRGSVSSVYRLTDEVLEDLTKELTRCFWIVDYEDATGEMKDDRLVFKHHSQGISCKHGYNYEPFHRIRRLLYFKQGEYLPVDRISFFATCLNEILENLYLEKKIKPPLLRNLKKYISSSNFRKEIAEFIAKHNQEHDLDIVSIDYEHIDSFFLIQNGGLAAAIHRSSTVPCSPLATFEIATSDTPVHEFFVRLCKKVEERTWVHGMLNRVLAGNQNHIFTLDPQSLVYFLEKPKESLEQLLYLPAKRLLTLSYHRPFLESLLGAVAEEEESRRILNLLPDQPLCNAQARCEILKHLDPEFHARFDELFDTELRRSCFSLIEALLDPILNDLGVSLHPDDLETFKQQLRSNWVEEELYLPKQIALLIKECFHFFNLPYVSPTKIEMVCCWYLNLPFEIELGDLNYIMEFREYPQFQKLTIRYDLARDEIALGVRTGVKQESLSLDYQRKMLSNFYISV